MTTTSHALVEIDGTALYLTYAAEEARRITGDIIPSDNADEQVWIQRVAHGVVLGLTAWNYPAALTTRKMGPALVAGNTIVIKSHEGTPLSAFEIAQLSLQAGLPPGVINVVSGTGAEFGNALVKHPIPRLITLTGSVRAGKEIFRNSADDLKVLRLELGGKAPFIVAETVGDVVPGILLKLCADPDNLPPRELLAAWEAIAERSAQIARDWLPLWNQRRLRGAGSSPWRRPRPCSC